jgi:isopentenyl phosphate kinase
LSELVFCKLGGSIITDKQRASTPRPETIERLAAEIGAALDSRPELRILLGHGSGSFGHVLAKKYHVAQGISDTESWWGYAETAAVAGQLNRIVTDTLIRAGVPVVSIQPSASARCQDGMLVSLDEQPVREALRRGLVPLIYGDVAFDAGQGCTIVSTENEFAYLAARLRPARIVLVGEVDGVYDGDPLVDPSTRRIPHITPETFAQMAHQLKGSHGTDVTGGMSSKVRQMVDLVAHGYTHCVHLISGKQAGALTHVLLDPDTVAGTVISKHSRDTERNFL